MSQFQFPFILIACAALLIIFAVVFLLGKPKEKKRLTPLASLAFAFIIAGIIFGENKIFGYSLMALGVILAICDAILKSRK
jgi:hypothetical protein